MANSYIEYHQNLSETTYSVPFNVLSIDDVNVKGYDGTTWSDLTVSERDAVAKTVKLDTAPSAFQKIRVWRNTGTTQLVDFQNGSRLSESDLDTAYQQGLFVAQEVSENASTGALAVGETGAQGATGAAGADGSNAEPFQPVAVTGATPSLDVGSYNFFDQGVLTANTTVSFASVPTNANWKYSFVVSFQADAWNISSSAYSQSFSVVSQQTNPEGVTFKPDGTKMYVVGQTPQTISEYNLNTAWDISTAVYSQLFSISSQDTQPMSSYFKPDGTKMYVLGQTGKDVNEYNLSTAWDISTAVYSQLFSVSAQELYPTGFSFKPDGTKMYVTGPSGDDVNEYALSTAWNISTASFTGLFYVGAQDATPRDVFFKPDGTKMYVVGGEDVEVNEYALSTAWDVTTASYSQNFIFAEVSNVRDVFFKPDGAKMYAIGNSTVEYDLGTAASLTLPASVVGTPNVVTTGQRVTYDFFTMDGGTTVNLIGEELV